MSFFSKVHERILRKFIFHGVDFVLVGGHAAVFYGVRRTTSDIDILVRPTVENGTRIVRAFKDLKLGIEDILPADFTTEQVFTFGMEPDAVDLLTFSRGVSIDDIFDNATHAKLDNLTIKVIDIKDLLKNKEALDRPSEKGLVDQQDILALKRILKSR
jgi:predicted nucleotidyltransferase